MAYFIRVLSPKSEPIPLSVLSKALGDAHVQASLATDTEGDAWEELVVAHPDETEICVIDRTTVDAEGLGREEIEEFLEEIADCQPESAVRWLTSYLSSVRSIYAIQILGGTNQNNGWEVVGALKSAIFGAAGGIIQADNEGFSNEDGYHILWQFADNVTGDWWMAILDNGRWRRFSMELGSPAHRAAFLRGEVPAGIKASD